jgi:valyl-tRNA synthetase
VALRAALSTLLKLLAPFLPFVTEEVWSWWQEGSIHRAAWPSVGDAGAGAAEAAGTTAGPSSLDAGRRVLAEIRRRKTEAGVSLRAPVAKAVVSGPPVVLALVEAAVDDLKQAGAVEDLQLSAGDARNGGEVAERVPGAGGSPLDQLAVEVTLA